MMMIKNGFYEAISLAMENKLDESKIEFLPGAACCVVLASKGYPGSYKKELTITGLNEAKSIENVKIFHAGTKIDKEKRIVTSGGRVLGVTGYSEKGIAEAQRIAYEAAGKITIPDGWAYRTDIGQKAIDMLKR